MSSGATRRTIARMTKFQVKTESPAIRCEICHQVDLFDPATGTCTRCEGINPDIATESTIEVITRRRLYRYVGPRNRTFGAYCWNVFLGGLIPTLFFSLPLFHILIVVDFLQPFDSPLLKQSPIAFFFLFFILPNTVASIRANRFIIRSNEPFTLAKLWSASEKGSAGATLILFIFLFLALFGSQLHFGTRTPLETLFEILTLVLPLGVVCVILNRVAGRVAAEVIRFSEKDRVIRENVVNAEKAG